MTYSFTNQADQAEQAEARENARSADRMATLILVLMVVWLFGAALMFTAAYKGSTMHTASPVAVDNTGPTDATAAPLGMAPAAP